MIVLLSVLLPIKPRIQCKELHSPTLMEKKTPNTTLSHPTHLAAAHRVGWMDGWMDGWMVRWMDGWIYGWTDR